MKKYIKSDLERSAMKILRRCTKNHKQNLMRTNPELFPEEMAKRWSIAVLVVAVVVCCVNSLIRHEGVAVSR